MPNWIFRPHIAKDGRKILYARSMQDIRGKDGKVTRKQVERSTGTASITEAREIVRQFDAEYIEALKREPEKAASVDVMTFADAVGIYVKSGNSGQYLDRIIEIIGLKAAKDIGQEDCLEVVARIYPNCKPTTTNRQVWTPINAVLRFVGLRPELKRPKGHDRLPTIDRTSIPPEGWFAAVLPHLSPSKRALMLLISLHGLRIGEAIKRTPADVDAKRWTLTLPKTKDGKPYVIKLSDPVIDALKSYKWRDGPWLFGTSQRSNISRDFRKACEKAGAPTFGTHRIGRHSFATKVLEEGKSLPYLKRAGRWASLKAVERYAHLASSEIDDEIREMAKSWHDGRKPSEIVPLKQKKRNG